MMDGTVGGLQKGSWIAINDSSLCFCTLSLHMHVSRLEPSIECFASLAEGGPVGR